MSDQWERWPQPSQSESAHLTRHSVSAKDFAAPVVLLYEPEISLTLPS